MKNLKKSTALLLAALTLAALLAACGKTPVSNGPAAVDLKEIVSSLLTGEKALGLNGKYAAFEEIKEGAADPALLGSWGSADGETVYSFAENGRVKISYTLGEANETGEYRYTCLKIEDKNVLCMEVESVSYGENDAEEAGMALSYSCYTVRGDALYMLETEDSEKLSHSYAAPLQMLYRADETGSVAASVQANPVDPRSFYGRWVSEEGEFTVDENGLTLGEQTFAVSLDENGRFAVASGEASTIYGFSFTYQRVYADDKRKNVESEGFGLNLSYTGKDKKDKPNLADVMVNWKKEYDYAEWYYTGSFLAAPNG